MSFLTPEQVLKVRIRGSEIIKLESLDDKEVRIVKMSSNAQLKTQDVQRDVASGKLTTRDFMVFMLQNSVASLDGHMISEEDANQLFDLLPLEDVTRIITIAAKLIGSSVKVKTSASGEAEVQSAPLTEAEKK